MSKKRFCVWGVWIRRPHNANSVTGAIYLGLCPLASGARVSTEPTQSGALRCKTRRGPDSYPMSAFNYVFALLSLALAAISRIIRGQFHPDLEIPSHFISGFTSVHTRVPPIYHLPCTGHR